MELVNRLSRNREEHRRMGVYSWLWCIAASVFAVFTLFSLWLVSVQVADNGMSPTLLKNDVILFDRLSKTFHTPRRGDILAFRDADEESERLGRVIGLPGETVVLRAGCIYLNGLRLDEPYVEGVCPDAEELVVPAGCFLVLPDQRDQLDTSDISNWILSADQISGSAFLRVFPWNRISFFR